MADTTTVYHPNTLAPNGDLVTYQVANGDLDRWVEQGWLKTPPKNEAVKAAQKAQGDAQAAALEAVVEGR